MNLPTHIVKRILGYADLSIDTRRAFGLLPRKLRGPWLPMRRRPLVYLQDVQKLFLFAENTFQVWCPIPLDYTKWSYALFNEGRSEYTCTFIQDDDFEMTYTSTYAFQAPIHIIEFKGTTNGVS